MHVTSTVLVLLLLTPAPYRLGLGAPRGVPMQSATPQTGTGPAEPASPPAKPGVPTAPGQTTPSEQDAGKGARPAALTPTEAPPLDLKTLEQQLKDTKAIGLFTKISLKNKVDDLLDDFSEYYEGDKKHTMTGLRQSYDLLVMKVLSVLQDEDPELASAIVSSREGIWRMLADPKTFATLKG